jgi:amphi-Trp domain-containing protein
MSSNGDKKSVSFEGQIDLNDALNYLKSLQAALKKGAAYIQNGAEVVALEPESSVTMEVEARSKKDKQTVKISLKWEKAEEAQEAPAALTISDKEPELVGILPEEEE